MLDVLQNRMKTDRTERNYKVRLVEDRTPPRDVGGILLLESLGVNGKVSLVSLVRKAKKATSPRSKSNNYQDLTEESGRNVAAIQVSRDNSVVGASSANGRGNQGRGNRSGSGDQEGERVDGDFVRWLARACVSYLFSKRATVCRRYISPEFKLVASRVV